MDESDKLDSQLSSLDNELLFRSRINGTFVPSPNIGSCTNDGSDDGLIGQLGSNITDFSINTNDIELLLNPQCESFPVTFDTILFDQDNFILSSPQSNVKKISYSIHEAFLLFDPNVTFVMISIYLLSIFFLLISKRINIRKNSYMYQLTRIWFHQDANDDHKVEQSVKVILTTSKLLLLHIIILIGALINTDLVSYTKPKVIDTVADAIESNVRMAYSEGSSTHSILKSSPDGTDRKKLFLHSLKQSYEKNESIFYKPNANEVSKQIKNGSLQTIVTAITIKSAQYQDCLNDDTNSGKYFHKSRNIVFTSRKAIFFSLACPTQIRDRVNHIHVRAMEAGVIEKDMKDFPEKMLKIFFNGASASITCLNQHNTGLDQLLGDVSISFQDIQLFFMHISVLYTICIIVFFHEIFIHKFKSRNQKRNMFRNPPFDMERHKRIMERARELDRIIQMRLNPIQR